jgi:IS5 family transposase
MMRRVCVRVEERIGPRGLVKDTVHVITLFALSNLWMARRQLMAMAEVRPRRA